MVREVRKTNFVDGCQHLPISWSKREEVTLKHGEHAGGRLYGNLIWDTSSTLFSFPEKEFTRIVKTLGPNVEDFQYCTPDTTWTNTKAEPLGYPPVMDCTFYYVYPCIWSGDRSIDRGRSEDVRDEGGGKGVS